MEEIEYEHRSDNWYIGLMIFVSLNSSLFFVLSCIALLDPELNTSSPITTLTITAIINIIFTVVMIYLGLLESNNFEGKCYREIYIALVPFWISLFFFNHLYVNDINEKLLQKYVFTGSSIEEIQEFKGYNKKYEKALIEAKNKNKTIDQRNLFLLIYDTAIYSVIDTEAEKERKKLLEKKKMIKFENMIKRIKK